MTDAINDETKGAVRLSRTDAVKLVAVAMGAIAAEDLAGCEQVVIRRRDAFRKYVVEQARVRFIPVLVPALEAIGGGELHGCCTFRVYEDGSDSGDTAQVVFSDHQQPYEAKFRISVSIPLNEQARYTRDEWQAALVDAAAARARDLRVGSMKREAREALIKAALNDTDEGRSVVSAVRVLAASLKAKA